MFEFKKIFDWSTPLITSINLQNPSSPTPAVTDQSIWLAFAHLTPPTISVSRTTCTNMSAFRSLLENWDGYGAESIKDATIRNAERLLESLDVPTPFLAPHPNGTITFEWDSTFGEAYLEIGRRLISFYAKTQMGSPLFLDTSVEEADINAISQAIQRTVFTGNLQTGTSARVTSDSVKHEFDSFPRG